MNDEHTSEEGRERPDFLLTDQDGEWLADRIRARGVRDPEGMRRLLDDLRDKLVAEGSEPAPPEDDDEPEPFYLYSFNPECVLPQGTSEIRPEHVFGLLEETGDMIRAVRVAIHTLGTRDLPDQYREAEGWVAPELACDIANFLIACCEVLTTGKAQTWDIGGEETAKNIFACVEMLPDHSPHQLDPKVVASLSKLAWSVAQRDRREAAS